MCSNGHINSTEVAVLCLLQKIMNDYAGAQKTTKKIHVRANLSSLYPKIITIPSLELHLLQTPHSGPNSPSQNYKMLIIIK